MSAARAAAPHIPPRTTAFLLKFGAAVALEVAAADLDDALERSTSERELCARLAELQERWKALGTATSCTTASHREKWQRVRRTIRNLLDARRV